MGLIARGIGCIELNGRRGERAREVADGGVGRAAGDARRLSGVFHGGEVEGALHSIMMAW
jgi:hypothetical protein